MLCEKFVRHAYSPRTVKSWKDYIIDVNYVTKAQAMYAIYAI